LSTIFPLEISLNIQIVRASGTIYIRSDGSVDPPSAPIQRAGNIYTFSGNINESIVVERSDIIIDGAGYILEGEEEIEGHPTYGIDASNTKKVTIRNVQIRGFGYGVYLFEVTNLTVSENDIKNCADFGVWVQYSLNSTISKNNIENCRIGILLNAWGNNTVRGNNIVANQDCGIWIVSDSYTSILRNNISHSQIGISWWSTDHAFAIENNIKNNGHGIKLEGSDNNYFAGNIISDNDQGISLDDSKNNTFCANNITTNIRGISLFSANNRFYHNYIVNNTNQVDVEAGNINIWDDGYPSGGNYWSDYNGTDSNGDGIGDTPYIIDTNNKDNYPRRRMTPYVPSDGMHVPVWSQWWLWAIIALVGIAVFSFPLGIKYYRNLKEHRGIVQVYGREMRARARAHFVKDVIERRERIEKFEKKYGVKIRPTDNFEEIIGKFGIQRDNVRAH